MIVYHFLPASYALDDLKRQRIKIATIDTLNDPFELWSAAQPDPRVRRVLRDFKNTLARTHGMLCFTRGWENPVLWSHYAERHKGICLGFEVQDRILMPVRYVSTREPLVFPPTDEIIRRLLCTKFRDWSYEQELRVWVSLEERDNADGHYYYPFDDTLNLCEVIAGPLCEVEKSTIDAVLTGYKDPIRVIQARLAFNTFDIVPNQQGFHP